MRKPSLFRIAVTVPLLIAAAVVAYEVGQGNQSALLLPIGIALLYVPTFLPSRTAQQAKVFWIVTFPSVGLGMICATLSFGSTLPMAVAVGVLTEIVLAGYWLLRARAPKKRHQ